MNRLTKWAVIALGVAVLVIIGVLAFRGGGTSHADTSPTAFDLPALSGSGRVRLSDFRGRPVVVNLFASWCDECRVELPALSRAAQQLRGRVQFVGIDSKETGDGRAMASQYGLAASGFVLGKDVGPGGGAFHDALSAPGMPVTIFYDANGRIVGRVIASMSETELRRRLQQYFGA